MFTDFNLYVFIFTPKKMVRLTNNTIPTVEEVKDMGYFTKTYARSEVAMLSCDIVDRISTGTDKILGIGNVRPAQRGYVR